MAWQQYQMALEGAREETKIAAREQAKMAAGGVAEVEAYLADTRIASPHEGKLPRCCCVVASWLPRASLW